MIKDDSTQNSPSEGNSKVTASFTQDPVNSKRLFPPKVVHGPGNLHFTPGTIIYSVQSFCIYQLNIPCIHNSNPLGYLQYLQFLIKKCNTSGPSSLNCQGRGLGYRLLNQHILPRCVLICSGSSGESEYFYRIKLLYIHTVVYMLHVKFSNRIEQLKFENKCNHTICW